MCRVGRKISSDPIVMASEDDPHTRDFGDSLDACTYMTRIAKAFPDETWLLVSERLGICLCLPSQQELHHSPDPTIAVETQLATIPIVVPRPQRLPLIHSFLLLSWLGSVPPELDGDPAQGQPPTSEPHLTAKSLLLYLPRKLLATARVCRAKWRQAKLTKSQLKPNRSSRLPSPH